MTSFIQNIYLFIFYLFFCSSSFSQSLIELGCGIDINKNTLNKVDTNYVSQYKYIQRANLSWCGIKNKHLSPEINIDIIKQYFDYDYRYNTFSVMSGPRSGSSHYKYDILISKINLLLQYRCEFKKIKFYFGAGTRIALFNFSEFSGYDTATTATLMYVNGSPSYITYQTKTSYRHGRFYPRYSALIFSCSFDIPISKRIFISPNILYESAKLVNANYYIQQVFLNVSVKYRINEIPFLKRIDEKLNQQESSDSS